MAGKLRFSEWSGRDGERRSKIQVVADAVQFLDPPKKVAGPDGGVDKPADQPADRWPSQGQLTTPGRSPAG